MNRNEWDRYCSLMHTKQIRKDLKKVNKNLHTESDVASKLEKQEIPMYDETPVKSQPTVIINNYYETNNRYEVNNQSTTNVLEVRKTDLYIQQNGFIVNQ